jgi:hypothetical protein
MRKMSRTNIMKKLNKKKKRIKRRLPMNTMKTQMGGLIPKETATSDKNSEKEYLQLSVKLNSSSHQLNSTPLFTMETFSKVQIME